MSFTYRAGWPLGGHRRFLLIAAALASVSVAGCVAQPNYAGVEAAVVMAEVDAFNQDMALMAAQAAAVSGDYNIGPEDLLEVTLYDIEDHDGEPRLISVRVSNTGFITLPLVGKVNVMGLTPLACEESLRDHYLRFIHEPQITVFVKEYRSYRVSVVGHVENPGVLELRGRKTLLEALGLAGGLDEEAGRSVRVTRQTVESVQSVLVDLDTLTAEGDIRLNLALLPGDVISVPRAGIFYVEGFVINPGAYPLLADTTVSQALATAGGIDVAVARTGGTTLFRKKETGERQAIAVDIAAIRAGENEDFLVMADDVIVVPVSGPKFFLDRLTGLLRVGVNSRF